jgi:DNA-binding PadR family transcriptional regulator
MPNLNQDVPVEGQSVVKPTDTLMSSPFSSSNPSAELDRVKTTDGIGKARRKYKPSSASGLTGREYHVLQIVNCYGWCTPDMVRRIANYHGVPWTGEGKIAYRLLSRLQDLGFVVSRKLNDETKTIAYAATQRGLEYIRAAGDALLCDTNAIKDPASIFHFVSLNRIMLQFQSHFATKFWLSDFQVRSDNSLVGAQGLAKDYDSVAEIELPTGPVRFAVEYERWQQSAARYAKLCSILASEKYLHLVIFFLDESRLLRSMTPHFKSLGGTVYFVDYDRFLQQGADVMAHYWYLDKVFEAPLRNVFKHASHQLRTEYLPVHQLDLRFKG